MRALTLWPGKALIHQKKKKKKNEVCQGTGKIQAAIFGFHSPDSLIIAIVHPFLMPDLGVDCCYVLRTSG